MKITLWATDDFYGNSPGHITYIVNPHRGVTCNRVLYCLDLALNLTQPANELLNRDFYYTLTIL